ncbi:hypothetical protein [Lactococcus lactis]|uniref:hypothetical protein n=1 Tax=Lactococcus lactis TaxID=1358 RepID=UPI0024A6AFB3|nr:hypothetical protein [Lactococcus lactis]
MKKNISREEAKKSLVYDPYFEKGHYGSKIFQTIIALLGWCGVIIPFLWIIFPFVFPNRARFDHIIIYREKNLHFYFFSFFFLYLLFSYLFCILS